MKRVKLLGIAAGVFVLVASALAFFMTRGTSPTSLIEPGRVLKVGMECDYVPYNWKEKQASDTNIPLSNNKGAYAEGYDLQIAKLLAQQLGAKLEVLEIAWGDLLPALKDGKIDMIMSGMADTEDRKAMPDFSASTTYNINVAEYCVVVRKDSRFSEAGMLADFYGARVVGQKGTRLDTVIDQIPNVNHLPPIDTMSQVFDYLDGNKADAVVLDTESASLYVKEHPSFEMIRFSHGQGFELGFTGICVWTRRADSTLLKAINVALSKIPSEARQRIMDHAKGKSES